MVEKFINSRWIKLLFALSVAVFVGLGSPNRHVMLNSLIAFALALFIEYKYKILGKLFEIKSKKNILIALPMATYTVIEIGLGFYARRLPIFASQYSRTGGVIIRSFGVSEQFLGTGLFVFSVLAGIIALFVVFAAVYAIVSRFKKHASLISVCL